MKIKIQSKTNPNNLKDVFPTMLLSKSYKLDNGKETDSGWFSEFETSDYIADRSILENFGYKAQPASYKEIESGEYSLFQLN